MSLDKLDEQGQKILQKLASQGAESSAKAISKMINKKVDLEVRKISYLEVEKVSKTILDSETVVTTLYLKITGDVAGSILLIFPNECAFFLVDLLSDKSEKERKSVFSEYEKSILKEVSNIISGAFLKSLADYLDLSLVESIPDMATDMAQATMDSVLIDFAHSAENAITVDVVISSEEKEIRGHFFLLFDATSAGIIIEALNAKIKKEK